MRAWIRLVIQHRKTVVALVGVFTVLLLTQLAGLKLIIDPDNILPQEHHFVRTNELIESTFGNKFTVVITLTPNQGTIFQTEFLSKVKKLTETIESSPGLIKSHFNGIATDNAKILVRSDEGLTVKRLMESVPESAEDMETFKKALHSDATFSGILFSEDETTTQIIAEFAKIDGGFERIEQIISSAVEPYRDGTIKIHVGGLPIFLAALESFSKRMALLFPLALLIIGLIHYEAFRTRQALILPLVTALLAVIWSVGILGLLRQSFDVFNASTPILILAIAAGHAVQILKRYYEEFHSLRQQHPGSTAQQINLLAVEEALTKVGPVMVIACGVAALGFFSLTIFEIKTVRTFGLFTGFGVLSSLVIELTFIPALRAMLAPPSDREKQREQQRTVWDRLTDFFYNLVINSRKKIYLMTAALILTFSVGAYFLRIDNSQKGYFFDSLQVKKDDTFINSKMAGTNLIYVLINGKTEGALSQPAVLEGIEKLQKQISTQPNVGKTVSINNFIKKLYQMAGDQPNADSLPSDPQVINDLLEALRSNEGGGPSAWISSDASKTVIATFIKTDSSAYLESLTEFVKKSAANIFPNNIQVDIGGGAVNGVALNEVLIHEKILNIAQILFAVFLVTSIVFRSVVAGLLILVPLIAAVVINFGIMGILGIPLQIATALVSAMAVGIGADYGIYMSFRMREELRKKSSEEEALKKAFQSAGKATLFVSSAVAGGFGILMISWGFYIHIWMGFLIATAMITSSLAALTIFPALIFQFRPQFIFEGDKKTKS